MNFTPISGHIPFDSIDKFKELIDHPYRIGEFFVIDGEVVEVPDDIEEVKELINSNKFIHYCVNWEDDSLFFEDGKKVQSVY